MKERGIIMSGDNPKLILSDRKTQTRRIINPQPEFYKPFNGFALIHPIPGYIAVGVNSPDIVNFCDYGVAGDRLYVRETHWRYGKWVKNGKTKTGRQKWKFSGSRAVVFERPENAMLPKQRGFGCYKRPSIFMPKWAARIWIEILKVRVERVQDITQRDAQAEGICAWPLGATPRQTYAKLWDSLHGKGSWDLNEWVWVLDFKRI